jgi:hypothetical protein
MRSERSSVRSVGPTVTGSSPRTTEGWCLAAVSRGLIAGLACVPAAGRTAARMPARVAAEMAKETASKAKAGEEPSKATSAPPMAGPANVASWVPLAASAFPPRRRHLRGWKPAGRRPANGSPGDAARRGGGSRPGWPSAALAGRRLDVPVGERRVDRIGERRVDRVGEHEHLNRDRPRRALRRIGEPLPEPGHEQVR